MDRMISKDWLSFLFKSGPPVATESEVMDILIATSLVSNDTVESLKANELAGQRSLYTGFSDAGREKIKTLLVDAVLAGLEHVQDAHGLGNIKDGIKKVLEKDVERARLGIEMLFRIAIMDTEAYQTLPDGMPDGTVLNEFVTNYMQLLMYAKDDHRKQLLQLLTESAIAGLGSQDSSS